MLPAVCILVMMGPQILLSDVSASRRVGGVAADVVLIAFVVATYARRRPVPGDWVVLPVLTVAVGSSLTDSMATMGIAYGLVVGVSMYGSLISTVLRTLGVTVAVPAAVALHPLSLGRYISWHDPTLIAIPPQLVLVAALTRILYRSLVAQERIGEQQALLVRTGSRLLGIRDVDEVHRLARIASGELGRLAPGTAAIFLVRDRDTVTIVDAVGLIDDGNGRSVPARVVNGLDATDTVTTRPVTDGLDVLRELAPGVGHWQAAGLTATDGEHFLLVGGRRPVPPEDFAMFRALGQQVAMAEASCLSRAQLHHQAHHDQLTGLPTRRLFFAKLTEAVESGVPGVTLLNIDLDNFKQVNDVYGHAAGDELLTRIADRLNEASGPGDVPARFGGDEFAVLLTAVPDPAEATQRAERLCRLLQQPVELSAATVTVGASIGLASWQPPLTAGDLTRCADIAMYSAKAQGKNRVECFTTERHGDIVRHRTVEDHIATAVERGEIVVYYQPYVDLPTGRCAGVEALVRWDHPTLGLVQPDEFLPVVERLGLSMTIGTHVLRVACRELAALSAQRGGEHLKLGVNIAKPQLLDPGFADTVREALAENGLPPDRLALELAAGSEPDDPVAVTQLRQLAETGIRISIDSPSKDQPSLDALWAFPVHQLKMGVALLGDDGPNNGRRLEAVQLMAALIRILRLDVVLKHVESTEQLDLLLTAGVNHAQGYLFGPPMAQPELGDWLRGNDLHTLDPSTVHRDQSPAITDLSSDRTEGLGEGVTAPVTRAMSGRGWPGG
jgi:diguanylate cyclase (GGDEF)-like protein